MILPLFFFLPILVFPSQAQQQPYGDNAQLNCLVNGSSTLGYTCNGASRSCPTYLTFRSQTNYQTPSQIALFLNSSSASISQFNDIPPNSAIPIGELVVIPTTCSCAGNYYQKNTSYTMKERDTYFTIANNTFQGLTTCQALTAQNSYDPRNLVTGMEIQVPLRCGCPSVDQMSRSGIKYLVTYLITWGDDIHSIAQTLNSDYQSILDASGLSYTDAIYPFTTLLIPMYTKPTKAQVRSLDTPASPGPGPGPSDFSPIGGNGSTKKRVDIGIGIGAGFLFFCGFFSWYLCCFCRKIAEKKRVKQDGVHYFKGRSYETENGSEIDLPLFDFDAIEAATNYFAAENKLGVGGFGPVYKGMFAEDKEIAVKRLAKTSQQGVEEFKNEVMLIAKLQHRNLVRLIGCCIEGDERILVYEFMPNKSLDAFLFVKEKSVLLDWRTRHQIIVGITHGLLYLHHDSRLRIIHRDLKASNILLDGDMNPKISDFGMARIFGGDEKDFNTRKVVGTYGYMSPEYAMEGIFSVKSDVFSYGVLLLEIISGRRNRGDYPFSSHINLVAHVWSLWNEGEILQLVDESISHSCPIDEVFKYIKIGLLCVQEHPEDRPLLSSVIQMLGVDIASLPQPKKPGFITRFCPFHADPSFGQGPTSNEITFSMFEGR